MFAIPNIQRNYVKKSRPPFYLLWTGLMSENVKTKWYTVLMWKIPAEGRCGRLRWGAPVYMQMQVTGQSSIWARRVGDDRGSSRQQENLKVEIKVWAAGNPRWQQEWTVGENYLVCGLAHPLLSVSVAESMWGRGSWQALLEQGGETEQRDRDRERGAPCMDILTRCPVDQIQMRTWWPHNIFSDCKIHPSVCLSIFPTACPFLSVCMWLSQQSDWACTVGCTAHVYPVNTFLIWHRQKEESFFLPSNSAFFG